MRRREHIAPLLPATTLVDNCYEYMFDGCENLNYIAMKASDVSASACLDYWVQGVSSSGTIYINPYWSYDIATEENNYVGVPQDWGVSWWW